VVVLVVRPVLPVLASLRALRVHQGLQVLEYLQAAPVVQAVHKSPASQVPLWPEPRSLVPL
jgi:hypothetical protein